MYSLEAHLLLSILLLTEPRKPLAEVYIWLDRATLHVKKIEGQRKGAESQIDGLLRVILNFDLLDIFFLQNWPKSSHKTWVVELLALSRREVLRKERTRRKEEKKDKT